MQKLKTAEVPGASELRDIAIELGQVPRKQRGREWFDAINALSLLAHRLPVNNRPPVFDAIAQAEDSTPPRFSRRQLIQGTRRVCVGLFALSSSFGACTLLTSSSRSSSGSTALSGAAMLQQKYNLRLSELNTAIESIKKSAQEILSTSKTISNPSSGYDITRSNGLHIDVLLVLAYTPVCLNHITSAVADVSELASLSADSTRDILAYLLSLQGHRNSLANDFDLQPGFNIPSWVQGILGELPDAIKENNGVPAISTNQLARDGEPLIEFLAQCKRLAKSYFSYSAAPLQNAIDGLIPDVYPATARVQQRIRFQVNQSQDLPQIMDSPSQRETGRAEIKSASTPPQSRRKSRI